MSNLTGQQIRAGLFYLKLQSPDKIKAVTAEIHQLLPGYQVQDLSLFRTSMPSAIQQAGAVIGMPQADTPRPTERPLISEAASVRLPGPQDVKHEQGTEQSKGVSEQATDEALLLKRAEDLGFNGDTEILKAMELMRQVRNLPSMEALENDIVSRGLSIDEVKETIRRQYLTARVLQSEVYGQVPFPTNDDIRRYYDAHVQDFNQPAGVHLREVTILTGNREQFESQRKKAEAALAAVRKGDDFRDVAAKFSESQTAQQGGDLGFFAKGEMAPLLEGVTNNLEKGEVSDIIPAGRTYDHQSR